MQYVAAPLVRMWLAIAALWWHCNAFQSHDERMRLPCWYFLYFPVGDGAMRGCVRGGGCSGTVVGTRLAIGKYGIGRGGGLLCGGENGVGG
jgi:hypothetical protein